MAATKQIIIGAGERVCLNCNRYQRYMREIDVPGEIYKKMIATNTGYCTALERQRGALCQPCKGFETKENPRS